MERDESRHPSIGYIRQNVKRLAEVFLNRYLRIPFTRSNLFLKDLKISENRIEVSIFTFCDKKYNYYNYTLFLNFVYCIDRNQKSKETHTCALCCEFAPSGSQIIVRWKIFSASESITMDSPSAKTPIGLLYCLAQKAQEKILPYLQRIDGEKCLLNYIIDLVRGLDQKVNDLNQKFRDLNQKLGYKHSLVYLVNRVEYDGYTGKTFVGIKIGEILAFIPVNFSIYAANIGGKISYHTILTIDGTHVYLMPPPSFMGSPIKKSLSQENSAIEVLPLPVETGRSAFYSFSDTNLDALLEKVSQILDKFIDKLQEEIEKGRAINIHANPVNLVYALMTGLVEIGKAFASSFHRAKFNFSFAQDPNSLNFLGKVEVSTKTINPLIRIDLNAEVKNSVKVEIIITERKTIESRETYDVCDEETLRATLKDVTRKLREVIMRWRW